MMFKRNCKKLYFSPSGVQLKVLLKEHIARVNMILRSCPDFQILGRRSVAVSRAVRVVLDHPYLVTNILHNEGYLNIIHLQRNTKLPHFFMMPWIERVAV